MTERDRFLIKIKQAKEEIKTSGPIHKRDLFKAIKRMERDLKMYDRFQAEARRCGYGK